MFETREIRWFFQTNDSQISKWFEENNYSFGKTDPRTPDSLKLLKTLGIPKTQFLSSALKSEISKFIEIKLLVFSSLRV